MDIADVARKSGVAASALRYYERKGLIRSLPHGGARRQFAPAVLEQLALIALGQAAGFSLDEIRAMFTPDGQPDIDRSRLAAKADDIDRTVRGLKAMSQGLRHAAACPAPSHAQCPSFQRLLKAAADGALGLPQGRLAPRRHAAAEGTDPATAKPRPRAASRPAPTAPAHDDALFKAWHPAPGRKAGGRG